MEVCGYNTVKGGAPLDQRFSTERKDSYYARARKQGRHNFIFVRAPLPAILIGYSSRLLLG